MTSSLRTPGIRRRLTLGFLAVILAFACTIPVTFVGLAQVREASQAATQSAITLRNVAVFQQQIGDVRASARDLASHNNERVRADMTVSLQEALDAARCIGRPAVCTPELQGGEWLPAAEAARWRAIAEHAADARSRFELTVASDPATAVRTLDAEYAEQVHAPSQALARRIADRGLEAQDDIRSAAVRSAAFISISVAIAALLASMLSVYIPSRFMRRLEHLRHVAHRLAHGDLTARADHRFATRIDEIGDLIVDFNLMAMAMEQQTTDLRTVQHQLHIALQQEQERSTRDPLTGLRNHRYFQEALHAELERARRAESTCSIAVLDLDDFKQVNDRFGHAVGDGVLRSAAKSISDNLRPYDLACRLGGEEFGIIFPDTTPQQAHDILNRVAAVLAPHGPNGERLTFSGGVACWPLHARDQSELYQRADEAAYLAKSTGKAHTMVYDPLIVPEMTSEDRTRQRTRDAMLQTAGALARAVDHKDPHTHDHSELVAIYAATLARALELDENRVQLVYRAGLLHDIGKIGIPDTVLTKSSALDEAEWAQLRMHSEYSFRILESAQLEPIASWTRHHHEHFDGTGYPARLAGSSIPLESRIILVADAFDTMTSDRLYRPALGVTQAIEELRAGAGNQFDPKIANLMIFLVDQGVFDEVMQRHGRLVDRGEGQLTVPPAREIGSEGRVAALDGHPPTHHGQRAA